MSPAPSKQQLPNSVASYQPRHPNAPKVVGLYGIPGAGKTYMLEQLRKVLPEGDFAFYDGSKVLESLVPGGLDTFHELSDDQRVHYRETAIESVQKDCAEHGYVGVVAGHFMFWSEGSMEGSLVCTPKDLMVYTHIIYLNVPAEVVAQRREDDNTRKRPIDSTDHLRKWQELEKAQLLRRCHEHGILFSLLSPSPTAVSHTVKMLRDFREHSEQLNMAVVERRLDDTVVAAKGQLQTMLVLDADRTLSPEDTGSLFWEELARLGIPFYDADPLKTLFSGPLGYSYTAFRQATLMYEDTMDDTEFDALCTRVASKVTLYPEFEYLLQKATSLNHVGAVIITCGLRDVWDKVLARYGLSDIVKVIGGGRIADGLVVTENVKGALVQRLRKVHDLRVWAFGDSPLDLKMLTEADHAIIVVGEEHNRSSTMDSSLRNAIEANDLQVRQTLLPRRVSPRLDASRVPIVELMDVDFLQSVFHLRQDRRSKVQLAHATKKTAASLLMTPMRDAAIAGPALRKAHHQAGQYLALEYLSEIIGLEEYATQHVQGHSVPGFRILKERATLIVALMRGGEPMALGVSDVLPLATFMHARHSSDIKEHHLQGRETIILVDSVINSGRTIVEFAEHVHSLRERAQIVIVAGVVQADFVSMRSPIHSLASVNNIRLVALRLSENKFKGQGGTDTGNRLFNSMMLE